MVHKMKLPVHDLDYILQQTTSQLWEHLRNQRIFITGGTGFFGCWLLESFVWANEQLALNAKAFVLTRNIENFRKKCPHLLSHPALLFHEGDVTHFTFPSGHFSHVIHGATEASVSLNKNNPKLMFDTIVQGTQNTLEFAKQCGAQNFLLTSSGAVYGKQPPHLTHIPEDYIAHPEPEINYSAYAEGKKVAEQLCAQYEKKYKVNVKIARCFAFVGPYLPLDTHFAIGNFIRDGLKGNSIHVQSDGSSFRSYLYAAELTIWLWTILFRGKTMRPYNVGSNVPYSIREIAHHVADCFGQSVTFQIEEESTLPPERYIPDVSRAENELGLAQKMGLKEAIQLTKEWYTMTH